MYIHMYKSCTIVYISQRKFLNIHGLPMTPVSPWLPRPPPAPRDDRPRAPSPERPGASPAPDDADPTRILHGICLGYVWDF